MHAGFISLIKEIVARIARCANSKLLLVYAQTILHESNSVRSFEIILLAPAYLAIASAKSSLSLYDVAAISYKGLLLNIDLLYLKFHILCINKLYAIVLSSLS